MKNQVIENVENYGKLIQQTVRALESIPEIEGMEFHENICRPGLIALDLPYDMKLFKQFRKLLGKNWKIEVGHNPNYCDKYLNYNYYNSDGVELKVYVDPEVAGSTCKRVQKGVEIVEKSIYEIVCE